MCRNRKSGIVVIVMAVAVALSATVGATPEAVTSGDVTGKNGTGAATMWPRKRVTSLVHKIAPKYSLDPKLVLAVIAAESGFNPKAHSPQDAQGLMQLIPETAERFGVSDPWDAEQNLHGGMAYLRWLVNHFQGNVKLALAGYNAGEKAVERHGGIPPYAETQAYVRKVLAHATLAVPELVGSSKKGGKAAPVPVTAHRTQDQGGPEGDVFAIHGDLDVFSIAVDDSTE